MRDLISGVVGTLWGGAILLSWFVNRNQSGAAPGAYSAGRSMAVVFGGLLLAGGVYYLQKAIRSRNL